MASSTTVTYRADRVAGIVDQADVGPTLVFANEAGEFGVSLPAGELPLLIESAGRLFSQPPAASGEQGRVRALNVRQMGVGRAPDGSAFVLQFQLAGGGFFNLALTPAQADQLNAMLGAALEARAG